MTDIGGVRAHPKGRGASRAELAKRKIESLYATSAREKQESRLRLEKLDRQLAGMNVEEVEKKSLRKEHMQKEMAFMKERRRPMMEADFEVVKIIGRGAFGEVILVKHRTMGGYYAMKKLRKMDVFQNDQVGLAWSERQVLVDADHPFVCRLCYAFQSTLYLYLVMEFLPGGDLLTLLIKRERLTEAETKFYVAEMIVAIDTVHRMGFIHRDIKPDNLLLDKNGHIKLADFGLCKGYDVHVDAMQNAPTAGDTQKNDADQRGHSMHARAAAYRKNARKQAFSTVGT